MRERPVSPFQQMTIQQGKHQNDSAHPRPGCPRCGDGEPKPIVYGFVDVSEYLELGKHAPDFELGGLTPRNESWCCVHCGHKW